MYLSFQRHLLIATLLLLFTSVVNTASSDLERAHSRVLLQRPVDCSKVHTGCDTCRAVRVPGTRRSQLICSQCKPGWKLRKALDDLPTVCDCQPGFLDGGNGFCQPCPQGKWCPGGDATINPNSAAIDCPRGLATIIAGAMTQAQCFTLPGYGRSEVRGSNGKVTYSAVQCPVGTFNVGRNTGGCQRCASGLTTAGVGAGAASECKAPAGSYVDRGVGLLCPRGTYSGFLEANVACTACPAGFTTAAAGSVSAAACSVALKDL